MKKLLSSALLAGLLLGTTAPVFAAETDNSVSNTTTVNSDIAATYSVTIPAQLSIDLMSAEPNANATGTVVLDELTAAGSVTVTADVQDLALTGGTSLANETLATTISAGTDAPAKSSVFSLTNDLATKDITVQTTELSKDNLPGAYTGSINFTFDYVAAAAE